MPIHRVVAMRNERFPMTVQTPPQPVVKFSSYVLRKDRNTPGTMISTTGSHEHFLNKLSTKSGTYINRGDDNSDAQSLYDLGRMKCSTIAIIVTEHTLMAKEQNACCMELKQSILILPTHIHPAKNVYSIQFQTNSDTTNKLTANTTLPISHLLTMYMRVVQMGFLKGLNKQSIQFMQMKVNIKETTKPRYLMMRLASLNYLLATRQKVMPTAMRIIIIKRNSFHVNRILRGFQFILIDHILECNATPIVIAALITPISKYPYQNFLCRFQLSQFIKNENYACELIFRMDILIWLQQFWFVMLGEQPEDRVKEVLVEEITKGRGERLGVEVMWICLA